MMEFAMLTTAFALGNLLSLVIAGLVFCNKKVMKAYTKYVMKTTNEIAEDLGEEFLN